MMPQASLGILDPGLRVILLPNPAKTPPITTSTIPNTANH